MSILVCLFLLVLTVSGRPQTGYNYQPQPLPQNQYGAPNIANTLTSNIAGLTTNFGSSGLTSFAPNFGQAALGSIGPSIGGSIDQNVQVNKHIYVFSAPVEDEIIQQKQIAAGVGRKHYKIIFIKTPSYSTASSSVIAAQAQNQEKTLIYVLVKRPEELNDVTVAGGPGIKPSKPEVYFINYKSRRGGTTAAGSLGTLTDGAVTGSIGTISGGLTSTADTGLSTSYGTPGNSGPY